MFDLRSILFLDPHVHHLKKLGATTEKPGIRLNFQKKNIKTTWPDQFEAYEIEGCNLSSGDFDGTLIRAPLRRATANSAIKNECVGEEEIAKIIDLICDDGHLWLLLLKRVTKIEVVDLQTQTTCCVHERHMEKKLVSMHISGHVEQSLVAIRSKFTVNSGTMEKCRTYQLSNQSEVSVALPLCPESESEPGRVFSRLPMGMESGLAAHVSALFWTSADRRTIVLDLHKDLEGWAKRNHQYLKQIAGCVVTSIAKQTDEKKQTLLQFFPRSEKPSPVAEVLYDLFYQEVVQECRKGPSQVLFTVSEEAALASAGSILLVKNDSWPQALRELRAPLVKVSEDVFQSLVKKDSSLFRELTPANLREWLKRLDPSLDHVCNEQLLQFCLEDKPSPADLAGCPLILKLDGGVSRFLGHVDEGSPRFLCCSSQEEWQLAQHFPASSVLKFVSGEALQSHPQILKMDLWSVATLGREACGKDFVQSFWPWFNLFTTRDPSAKFTDPPFAEHPFDCLHVLEATEHGQNKTFQLLERKRALSSSSDVSQELAKGLEACNVLLVSSTAPAGAHVCPGVNPDSVARAVRSAICMKNLQNPFHAGNTPLGSWRAVAAKLALSGLPEAIDAARFLPAFRLWGRSQAVHPGGKEMFPCCATKALRGALRPVQLDILDEEEPRLVELLQKMGVKDMPLKTIADEALRQSHDLTLIAQLVRAMKEADLREALKGQKIFPGPCENLLTLEECLLWGQELDFEVIPRRMCGKAGEQFRGLEGKLQEIGCRWELDLQDVLDLAKQARDTGDVALSQKLIQRLDHHRHMENICASEELRSLKWLPASRPNSTNLELMASNEGVWQHKAKPWVGLVKPLVDAHASERVLNALTVPGEKCVDDAVLYEQLAACIKSDGDQESKVQMITPIYQRLKSTPAIDKWVWTACGFQSLVHISKDPEVEGLTPCLHRLRDDWHFLPVFESANKKLTPEMLLNCLDMSVEIPSEIRHKVQLTAINLLTHRASEGSESPKLSDLALACGSTLRIITREGNLLPVTSVFFHDMKWQSRSECPPQMEEVHEDISQSSCLRFGVRNLSEIVAAQCGCGEGDWLEVTGQQESLTTRLKGILKDYPWQSLVKEMLQNAEDAGASVFKVLIDRRPRGEESLLTPEMAALQGPCLWFFNDAVFQDKDFQRLVSLGQGSKASWQPR